MGLLKPKYVDLGAMSNQELAGEFDAASRRVHNPMRTHGSHVRNNSRMHAAGQELARRERDGRA